MAENDRRLLDRTTCESCNGGGWVPSPKVPSKEIACPGCTGHGSKAGNFTGEVR